MRKGEVIFFKHVAENVVRLLTPPEQDHSLQLTCLPINMMCSDDLFIRGVRFLLIPSDLHYHVALIQLVVTGQDGLLFCQGAYGVVWRTVHKLSL